MYQSHENTTNSTNHNLLPNEQGKHAHTHTHIERERGYFKRIRNVIFIQQRHLVNMQKYLKFISLTWELLIYYNISLTLDHLTNGGKKMHGSQSAMGSSTTIMKLQMVMHKHVYMVCCLLCTMPWTSFLHSVWQNLYVDLNQCCHGCHTC
jgi:hypothetical protein